MLDATVATILDVENVSQVFSTGSGEARAPVLSDVSMRMKTGEIVALLGRSGSGKSSLLRIMALEDKDFLGTAKLTAGFTLGHVPQEPRLNEAKDVRGNIEEAVAPTRALLNRHEEISNKLGESLEPDEMEKLLNELERRGNTPFRMS